MRGSVQLCMTSAIVRLGGRILTVPPPPKLTCAGVRPSPGALRCHRQNAPCPDCEYRCNPQWRNVNHTAEWKGKAL
jgi:hypothetical protein